LETSGKVKDLQKLTGLFRFEGHTLPARRRRADEKDCRQNEVNVLTKGGDGP